jgi:hypothetical protein
MGQQPRQPQQPFGGMNMDPRQLMMQILGGGMRSFLPANYSPFQMPGNGYMGPNGQPPPGAALQQQMMHPGLPPAPHPGGGVPSPPGPAPRPIPHPAPQPQPQPAVPPPTAVRRIYNATTGQDPQLAHQVGASQLAYLAGRVGPYGWTG